MRNAEERRKNSGFENREGKRGEEREKSVRRA